MIASVIQVYVTTIYFFKVFLNNLAIKTYWVWSLSYLWDLNLDYICQHPAFNSLFWVDWVTWSDFQRSYLITLKIGDTNSTTSSKNGEKIARRVRFSLDQDATNDNDINNQVRNGPITEFFFKPWSSTQIMTNTEMFSFFFNGVP